ncbi:MAG TPA: hypothetical protein VFN48_06070 [Solirubrobacteraceae bacterium]|nr:hypothetical protein [Solirubrobacteraceae bacterium]
MSGSSEEILIQRKLRAAELALETARRRRFERDEEVRSLETQISGLEAALAAVEGAREGDRARAEERVAAAHRAQLEAEQRLVAERSRRLALEGELAALRAELGRRDVLTRQLEAERRLRAVEGEAEMLSRRAAEFEHGLRIAALDAFVVVRELSDRVGVLLAAVGLAPAAPAPAPPAPAPPAPAPPEPVEAPVTAEAPVPVTAEVPVPVTAEAPVPVTAEAPVPPEEGLDFGRLDAALERLRAAAPRPESEG